MLAVMGRGRRLFGFVAARHAVVGHDHLRHRSLMRQRAAQHGSRRKRLHRQGQHQQQQQESVDSGTHAGSVIKKG